MRMLHHPTARVTDRHKDILPKLCMISLNGYVKKKCSKIKRKDQKNNNTK